MTTEVDGFAVVGEVLAGKYRVDKILGIGGMGMVVAATHLELDQRVALKFMLPGSRESADMAARFLREARAAGRLNSEHVCRVMDVGRFDNGTPYIVMEYLKGENLAVALRRRGPLRVAESVDLVLQAIEGLAEAHAHGIVHRDLKPDNLFLARRNDGATMVKVLDFGISKVAVTGVETGTGDIMGSPAYMAPEQMQSSRDVDARADVWSLGVVLYQMVVGKLPFLGDSLPLLCMHVVNDAPKPMSAIRGDLPDGFDAVVMKCLSKEPVDRYADVGELAEALAPFGPKDATTSVSRIQVVLRRTRHARPSTYSHEFSTIAPTLDHEPDPLPAKPGRGAGTQPPTIGPPQATTLGATSGQALARLRDAGRPWGLIGGIGAGIALVALVLVVVWRSGQVVEAPSGTAKSGHAPLASPVGAQQAASSAARSAGLTVEPIVDPTVEPIVESRGQPERAPIGSSAPVAGEPIAAQPVPGGAVSDGGVADPRLTPVDAASPGRTPARKKQRPRRAPGAVSQGDGGSGATAEPSTGSGAGSAAPAEDELWTHMTHDGPKP